MPDESSTILVTIFKLSPESGERVGLALTILLAYAVYLSLISDSIPQTSLSASLLSTYLATILLLQTIAVLLTVIYLDIYFTADDKPVPNYLLTMSSFLEKITSLNRCKKRNKVADNSEGKNDPLTEDLDDKTDANEKRLEKMKEWEDEEDDATRKEFTWKEVALLLDKITLYIYLIVVTVLTVAFVSVMVDHYNSSYTSDK
ncbi:acetylcholine receptor subunit beta-like [Mercenaria mercenaria]|uniref:acetylcholine receptor subunit beta-like n=1 Tax=Mercenaria mercenaria TaxID=6596 RepID=UPI00234E69A4|nr:acetylcholine receptor subunit beta-like [Mercenaria mercenaria]